MKDNVVTEGGNQIQNDENLRNNLHGDFRRLAMGRWSKIYDSFGKHGYSHVTTNEEIQHTGEKHQTFLTMTVNEKRKSQDGGMQRNVKPNQANCKLSDASQDIGDAMCKNVPVDDVKKSNTGAEPYYNVTLDAIRVKVSARLTTANYDGSLLEALRKNAAINSSANECVLRKDQRINRVRMMSMENASKVAPNKPKSAGTHNKRMASNLSAKLPDLMNSFFKKTKLKQHGNESKTVNAFQKEGQLHNKNQGKCKLVVSSERQ